MMHTLRGSVEKCVGGNRVLRESNNAVSQFAYTGDDDFPPHCEQALRERVQRLRYISHILDDAITYVDVKRHTRPQFQRKTHAALLHVQGFCPFPTNEYSRV
jgi:hypothetical protein